MARKRILIADDNADSRYSLRMLLKEYDVVEASGGGETIELARKDAPDCILLDVQMPDMNGFDVCARLRKDDLTRSIPIILVTGIHRDTASLVRGLAAGGDEYITKPVERRELLARVHAMLRIKDLQDQLAALNEDLEDQVRRQTEELRQIYASVPIGLYTLDASGRITSFNSHLERMLGYSAEEVVGKMSISGLFEEGYDALYWLDLARREGRATYETVARHRDGSLIPVFDARVVTTDHVGEHVGFTGYMQDVSRQHRVRDILKEQEAQAGVGRLAAGIVHEIANPISGAVHYLDATLKRLDRGEEIPADEMRQGAGIIRDALHRTTDLIRHLRGLTRPVVSRVGQVDPLALLRDIQHLMRPGLHKIGIEMKVGGTGATIHGDGGRLAQVFLNLVTNARDAMPDGGTLTVEVTAQDSTVSIRFTDTGTGMDEATREKIFDYLFTTKGDRGTGYGLTLSRDIIAEHRGRIEVDTAPGQGSTFVVTLPKSASGPAIAKGVPS